MTSATPGKLYITPTTAAVGGTLLTGIEERLITLSVWADVREFRAGSGSLAGYRTYRNRQEQAWLSIPLMGQTTDAIKLLWAHLTSDGATYAPNIRGQYSLMPSFAMVLRPDDSSGEYIYAPRWRMAAENEQAIITSPFLPRFEQQVLRMVASDSGENQRPFMIGTAAAIDAHYGLEE